MALTDGEAPVGVVAAGAEDVATAVLVLDAVAAALVVVAFEELQPASAKAAAVTMSAPAAAGVCGRKRMRVLPPSRLIRCGRNDRYESCVTSVALGLPQGGRRLNN